MQRLKGKTAVVTGATRGIGKSIAFGYAREGANVVVTGTNAALCSEVAGKIRNQGGNAIGVRCDISNLDGIQVLFDEAVKAYGEVNILMNNAGISLFRPFVETSEAEARKVIDVNLIGSYFCGQRAAKEMIRQGKGGKIINMASVNCAAAAKNISIYACTKAAVSMMTKEMALELAEHKINVNCIAAGVTLTDINREHLADPENERYWYSKIPWGRVGSPEDHVGVSIFFAGSESDYITGTTLFVDGGYSVE